MITYESRIVVGTTYLQALGQVVYNYATVEWNIVYLGSLVAPSFLQGEAGKAFADVVRGFEILSEVEKFPGFSDISRRFSEATRRKDELLKSIPITAAGGSQVLDGKEDGQDKRWGEADVWALANDLQQLDLDSNALYYKLKTS